MKFRTPRIISAALVAGLALGITSPALAQSATTDPGTDVGRVDVEDAKARCVQAIDKRLGTLDKISEKLDAADFVTEDHEEALESILETTEDGLRSTRDAIEDSSDPAELRRLCESIGPDFRVYQVVVPQARITGAADRIESLDEKVEGMLERFDAAVDRAVAAGADVSEAVSLRNEAVAQYEAAVDMVDGIADAALAVTPASFNEGPGAVVLSDAADTARTSHGELKNAYATGKAAVRALKAAIAAI